MTSDTTPSRERSRAVLYLVATAVLWSFGGVLIKWVSWNPLAIAGTRSLIALPFLLFFFPKRRITGSVSQIGGAAAYAATVILFVSATKLTTAANAILLQYMAPLFVAAGSGLLLGERVRWFDWLSILIACGGMALFFMDKLAAGGYWGNVVAIMSGVAFATMILFLRKEKDGDPLASVVLGNALTVLLCFPFMFHPPLRVSDWTGLVLLGIFQIGLSYVLYAEAIKHVTALEGILVPMIEPVLNPVWVLLLLDEHPGRFALIGGTVVMATIMARSVAYIFLDQSPVKKP
jgi:drug/metabolite transporter (DMT)-like permease